MPKLILLGTASAISDARHENTHMLLVGEERTILIDTASNPLPRLEAAGVDPERVSDVILTHFHPDHVSGFPLLLMNMWLMGRKAPLTVHGLHYTLDRIEVMLGLYGWSEWPNFFPVSFQPLPLEEKMLVLECSECVVHASPVKHFIPGIGLRIDFPLLGKALAYSSDTEPCPQVVKLANGVDVLIHEASGALPGHSSALQAADIARQAGARELLLIHYPATISAHADLVAEACQAFPGPVQLAEDLQILSFE